LVPAAQAVKLAELDGLNYSSDEFLAALESLPADSYQRALASEKDARNVLKASLLEKYLAEQARQRGLDTLPLVENALALVREEALIDWHVHSTGAHDVVARARRIAEETLREPTDEPAEYLLQQAFVSREEPNAQALITSISNDLENNPSQRSFAQVLSRYLPDVGKAAASGQGHITSADFDMGWHEPADIELRFRPFVESSVAGDIFGPLRVDLGWIFLSVVDTRQLKVPSAVRTLHMASMRRERRVREALVAELAGARAEAKAKATDDAPIAFSLKGPSLTTAESALTGTGLTPLLRPLMQQMGGLFQDLASLSSDAEMLGSQDGSSVSAASSSFLQNRPTADTAMRDLTNSWQQRREGHRVLAQQAWNRLGDEPPAPLLARVKAAQDRFLSRLQVRALASEEVLQAQVIDSELEALYQQNIERFYLPAQVKLRQIFLASDSYSEDDVNAVYEQVQRNPQTFAAAAMRVNPGESNLGGDGLGKSIALQALDPILFKAILSLEMGKVSRPITSSRGSHIVVLDGFTPAAVKPRDDVKDQLIDLYNDQRVLARERQLLTAWKQRVVVY
jgi:parvulin-like peptidyl-prolyl isomerase